MNEQQTIGIQVSSFRPVLRTVDEVKTACKNMKSMGCKVVQLQWIDFSVPIHEIALALEENEIVSVSVQEIYETFLQNKEYYLDLCEETNSKWLCISRIPSGRKSKEQFPLFLEELKSLMDDLKKRGMKLCFHPVSADYEPIVGVSEKPVETLMEDLPEMDLCLDLYHCLRSHIDVPAMLERYKERVCMVHFKESVKKTEVLADGSTMEKEVLVPVGSEDTDWTEIIKACKQEKVPYVFAEQESWEGDPFEALAQGFDFLVQQFERTYPFGNI